MQRFPSVSRLTLSASVGTLAVVAYFAVSMITPSTEAARLRNSFIASTGSAADFQWSPEHRPPDFLEETEASREFDDIVAKLGVDVQSAGSQFDKALVIARHLAGGPPQGEPIQTDTLSAYHTIIDQSRGYCADFTQVFNALAHAAGIPVREWGMAFDGFGGWGHAFNEIYDETLMQWVFIDSFNSFYVVDAETGRPLSALEFRERLYSDDVARIVRSVPIDRRAFGFKDEAHMFEYFARGREQFYLLWGNNVISYDAHPLVRAGRHVSRSLEQAMAIVAGIRPRIKILVTNTNGPLVEGLYRVKRTFLVLSTLALVAATVLVWQIRRLLLLRSVPDARQNVSA